VVHGAAGVVDEDRAPDAELVTQPPGRRELLLEAGVRGEVLPRVRLARVDEVPAEIGMPFRELVEQRTLCCAVRSGEGAELEHDPTLAPQLGQADALAVEHRQLAVRSPLPGMEEVRKSAELALVDAALDVGVEALVVVGRAHQPGFEVRFSVAPVVASTETGFAARVFRQRSASDSKPARTARPRRVRMPEDVSARVPITVLWSNMHIERSPQ
jgi:hypothetical protein